MFGLDTKSLVIGVAVGYFVVPRIVSPVMGWVASQRAGGDE